METNFGTYEQTYRKTRVKLNAHFITAGTLKLQPQIEP